MVNYLKVPPKYLALFYVLLSSRIYLHDKINDMKKVVVPDKRKGADDLNQYLENQKERVKALKKVVVLI